VKQVSIRHGVFAGLAGEIARGPETQDSLATVVVALPHDQCRARCGEVNWVLDKQGRVEVTVPVCNTEEIKA